jgi:hypothetical protein
VGVPATGPRWPLEMSWLGVTPTGGSAGTWGDTQTVWQPDGPGSHHGADLDDHTYAPAVGGEQRAIAVGEAKRYVADLGHCLLHVEVGDTEADHVTHLRPGSGKGSAPMVNLAGGPQLGRARMNCTVPFFALLSGLQDSSPTW